MSSPRLKWLRIHKYRNVVPGTFIEFNDGFNVLLGRNGTGKTTLLELIEMLWSRGFGRIADEAFHLECEAEFDTISVPVLDLDVQGFLLRASVENVLLETADGVRSPSAGSVSAGFSYRVALMDSSGAEVLVVEGTPIGASLTVREQSWPVAVLSVHSWPVLWSAPAQFSSQEHSLRESEQEERCILNWAQECHFMISVNPLSGVRFDESLAAFHALTDINYASNNRGVEGVRWELQRRLDSETKVYRPDASEFPFTPSALVRYCTDQLDRDVRREPAEFRVSHTILPWIEDFIQMTAYSGAWVNVRPDRTRRNEIVETLMYRTPDFRFVLPGERGEISAHDLSYGEKRLLSFLWYLACGDHIVIADELVNGFHHEWIERSIELIGGRQAFMASQNPLLLDSLPLGDLEYVRKCFITCRRGPETEGKMQWKNLSLEEAADFYDAYQRGTRYVHEILQGKGLW